MTDRPGRRPPPPLPSRERMETAEGWSLIYRFLLWVRKFAVAIPGGWLNREPNPVQVGGDGDAGSGNTAGWMSADATLAVPTGAPSGLGNANAEGSADAVVRQDHVHKRDVRVALNGSDVGTRNRLNFIAPAGTVTDDAGNDEVDVDLAAIASAGAADAELLAWVGIAMRQSSRS